VSLLNPLVIVFGNSWYDIKICIKRNRQLQNSSERIKRYQCVLRLSLQFTELCERHIQVFYCMCKSHNSK
jgi:bisphosphoglycerate-dependent phosphoglycerate mutase